MKPINPVHVYERFEEEHWWYRGRRAILKPLLHTVVPAGSGCCLVDVGCGAGTNLAMLANGYQCVGIDISERLIRSARQSFPTIEFICGHAPDDLGTYAQRADAFLLMDVIEHIADDRGYFERLFTAARPGALFLMTVPADPGLWSPHDQAVGHQRRYTIETLARIWSGLPCEPILVSYFNAYLHPLIRTVRALNNRLGRSSGEGGTDFAMAPGLLNAALAHILGAERRVLLGELRGQRRRGFRRGVSLIAIVKKRTQLPSPGTQAGTL